MQRLVDRIWNEFTGKNCHFIEINVLDGNGDPFQVYNGSLNELSSYSFSNILRDPCCFYFFRLSSMVHNWNKSEPDSIVRRELCWLTDPLPPEVIEKTHNSFVISWQAAKFCGIISPANFDSVTYTLEICEGVEWKQTKATRYMNDCLAHNYKTVYSGNSLYSVRVNDLKSANWYHFRLIVEYRGLKVMSETKSTNTVCSVPSAPSGTPSLYVLPIPSTFDGNQGEPSRLDVLICWSPSMHNGHPILKYQVQLCGIDINGFYTVSNEVEKKRKLRSSVLNHSITDDLIKDKKRMNQWVKSGGKSVIQIQNSLSSRSKSVQLKRLPSSTVNSPFSSSPMDQQNTTTFSDIFATSTETLSTLKWNVIYENLNRQFKMSGPGKTETEWHIRVRAKNALGWSPFSDILKVNSFTHPSLFHEANSANTEAVPVLTLPTISPIIISPPLLPAIPTNSLMFHSSHNSSISNLNDHTQLSTVLENPVTSLPSPKPSLSPNQSHNSMRGFSQHLQDRHAQQTTSSLSSPKLKISINSGFNEGSPRNGKTKANTPTKKISPYLKSSQSTPSVWSLYRSWDETDTRDYTRIRHLNAAESTIYLKERSLFEYAHPLCKPNDLSHIESDLQEIQYAVRLETNCHLLSLNETTPFNNKPGKYTWEINLDRMTVGFYFPISVLHEHNEGFVLPMKGLYRFLLLRTFNDETVWNVVSTFLHKNTVLQQQKNDTTTTTLLKMTLEQHIAAIMIQTQVRRYIIWKHNLLPGGLLYEKAKRSFESHFI